MAEGHNRQGRQAQNFYTTPLKKDYGLGVKGYARKDEKKL
jgi:hypothetical protein